MARSFHIYGYSRHSKDLYPHNRGDNFVIPLAKPLHLEGEWECGLLQFQYNAATDTPYYVCCDAVVESHVGDYKLPVLRRVRLKNIQYSHMIYVPLKVHDFNSIRVYMRSWNNKPPLSVISGTHCTLHFRRVA